MKPWVSEVTVNTSKHGARADSGGSDPRYVYDNDLWTLAWTLAERATLVGY